MALHLFQIFFDVMSATKSGICKEDILTVECTQMKASEE
jgi:hypothetical protein